MPGRLDPVPATEDRAEVAVAHLYRSERVEAVANAAGAPVHFRWRGRRYVVCGVIANWVEAVPWWRGSLLATGASGQCQIWRVEAAERAGSRGVYELRRISRMHDIPDVDTWHLVRVLD